jgi:hypothetical protein
MEMRKRISTWTTAALALLLAAPASQSASAQESDHPHLPIQHLAPEAMSAADRAAVETHQRELVESARIYGYNLEAGNWNYEQTLCAPMPEIVMLHYYQDFPDKTESLFTALVPRQTGRVRVVPVLYHNATPFLPAPKNPHNYAVFNDLVASNFSGTESGNNRNWLALSACYAEMTGGPNLPSRPDADIGIAGAPSPTVHLDVRDKSTRVTLANREGDRTYKVWSIAFNKDGKIIAADTEDRSVIAEKYVPESQPTATAELPETTQPEKTSPYAASPSTVATHPATAPSSAAKPATTTTLNAKPAISAPSAPPPSAATVGTIEESSEPGWKYILHPADPRSTVVPPAPPPKEKTIPTPPDPTQPSSPADQTH